MMIDSAAIIFVLTVLGIGAGCVVFIWTRLNAQRAEITGACAACRAEYHGRIEQVRTETGNAIVRMHTRQDEMQKAMVDKDDLKAIREDIRHLSDQLGVLNSNIAKYAASFHAAE